MFEASADNETALLATLRHYTLRCRPGHRRSGQRNAQNDLRGCSPDQTRGPARRLCARGGSQGPHGPATSDRTLDATDLRVPARRGCSRIGWPSPVSNLRLRCAETPRALGEASVPKLFGLSMFDVRHRPLAPSRVGEPIGGHIVTMPVRLCATAFLSPRATMTLRPWHHRARVACDADMAHSRAWGWRRGARRHVDPANFHRPIDKPQWRAASWRFVDGLRGKWGYAHAVVGLSSTIPLG